MKHTFLLIIVLLSTVSFSQDEENIKSIVHGHNRFALNLCKKVCNDSGNIFFSPYSISSAFAIIYAGAKGRTEQQITDVLKFNSDKNNFYSTFSKLLNNIKKIQNEGFVEIGSSNSIWVQNDFPIQSSYLNEIGNFINPEIKYVDFRGKNTHLEINAWVEKKTKNMIKNFVPENALSIDTKLAILNTLYFKDGWKNQFNQDCTKKDIFYVTPEKTVNVDMMYQRSHCRHTCLKNEIDVLEMDYNGGKISILFFIHKTKMGKQGIEDIEALLEPESVDKIVNSLAKKQIHIYLPKFKINFKVDLVEKLKSMGLVDAFKSSANFTGLSNKRLFIDKVLHGAVIEIDEKGTEAAGASAIIAIYIIDADPSFITNHPFVCIIREKNYGTILFIGKVLNPLL